YHDHRVPGRALGEDLLPRPITLDPGSRCERVDLARFELAEQKVALQQVPFLLMRRSGHRNLRKRYRYPHQHDTPPTAGQEAHGRLRNSKNFALRAAVKESNGLEGAHSRCEKLPARVRERLLTANPVALTRVGEGPVSTQLSRS